MHTFTVFFDYAGGTLSGLTLTSKYKPVRACRRIAQELADATQENVAFQIYENGEQVFHSVIAPVSISGFRAS